MSKVTTILDKGTKRRIAAAAVIDPRTLEKFLRGDEVRGGAAIRAADALRAAGIEVGGEEAGDGKGTGRRGRGGGAGVRRLAVVEVMGLLPGETGGANRLFVTPELLDRLASAKDPAEDALDLIVLVLECIRQTVRGGTALDEQHTAAEVNGIRFVAARDGSGALLLELDGQVVMNVAGAVFDVREELCLDRAALRAAAVALIASGARS